MRNGRERDGDKMIGRYLRMVRPGRIGMVIGIVMILMILAAATLGQASDDSLIVASDAAIVELELPDGATVEIEGRPLGEKRRFKFAGLDPGRPQPRQLRVTFPDGRTVQRLLLVEGGRQIKLALQHPAAKVPEVFLQSGHSSYLTAAVFSSDGRYAATGGDDGRAIVWDVQSGRQLRTFHAQPDDGQATGVASLAFQPQCINLLVGQGPQAVLFDTATGRVVRQFSHGADVASVAFSPDGQTLATGGWDKKAILWETDTGRKLRSFEGPPGGSCIVAFTPDGRSLLTAGGLTAKRIEENTSEALLYDIASGEIVCRFAGHEAPMKHARFSPDGRLLFVRENTWTGILYDVGSGEALHHWPQSLIGGAFSPDGRRLVTSMMGAIVMQDVEPWKTVRNFHSDAKGYFAVDYSPDGKHLLVACWNDAVLLDAETGKRIRTLTTRIGSPKRIALCTEPHRLVVGGFQRPVMWNLDAGLLNVAFDGFTHHDRNAPIAAVAISRDGRLVASGSGIGDHAPELALWDAESGQLLQILEGMKYAPLTLEFSPDGRILAGAGGIYESSDDPYPGEVTLWDTATGELIRRLEGHVKWVVAATFLRDGQQLLTASWDGKVILWDVDTGQAIWTAQNRDEPGWSVTSLALRRDERQMAIGDLLGRIELRNVQTGELEAAWEGHAARVSAVAYAPGGERLLSGGADRRVVLWDVATHEALRSHVLDTQAVADMALSADGREAWIACEDGSVRLWEVATGDELAQLVALDDGREWLVVTPQGLFDGSELGRGYVTFRLDDALDVVPVDRFFQDLYRAGLLARIGRGERLLPEIELGRQLPPGIRFVEPAVGKVAAPSATLELEIVDRGGGIGSLRLYQNGARILAPGDSHAADGGLRRTFRVALVEGENHFRATVASRDGSWESEPAELSLHFERPLEQGELYLVVAGINDYADPSMQLDYAADDARAIADLFRRRGSALYKQVHVIELVDAQVTKAGLREALSDVARRARPQDTLVVFVAGHGLVLGQRYYLICHDFLREADSVEADVRSQGLPADVLGDWLAEVRSLKRIMIFDTCHAGGAIGLDWSGRDTFAFRGAIERLGRAQGVYTIAAAAANQQAKESRELGHGVLSYALLAALGGVDRGPLKDLRAQADAGERVVDVVTWLRFAQGHVPRLTEQLYGVPQFVEARLLGESFPLLPLDDF